MELQSLRLKNFVTHKDSFVDFTKGDSFNIVSERNGDGKSLLMDAICWCLWGKMIRGGRAEDVIGRFIGYTFVETIWIDDQRYIKIKRYRKHSKYHNRVMIYFSDDGNKWVDIDRSKETVRDTDDYIQKLFRMNYDSFIAGITLTKSKPELNFFESKDTRRKEILTGLLNLDWIDKAKEKAKQDLNKIHDNINQLELNLDKKTHNLDNVLKIIKSFKKHSSNFELEKKSRISRLRLRIKKLDEIVVPKINPLKDLRSKYLLKTTNFKKYEEIILSLYKKLDVLHNKKERIRYEGGTIESEIEKLNKKMVSVRKDNGDKICEYCGSKLAKKNISSILKHIEKDIYENEKILKLTRKKLSDITSKQKIYLSKKEKYQMKMDVIQKYLYKISTLDVKIEKTRNLIKLNKEKHALKKDYLSELKSVKASKNKWIKELKNYNDKKKILLKEIELLKTDIRKNNRKMKLCEYAVDAYGNSGIKNDIISSKIALLEEKMNYYLSKISRGDIVVRLDNRVQHGSSEKIGVMITDSEKVKPIDYNLWSGGQRTVIRFAGEYALNSIMEIPINLLIVDEGFDYVDPSSITKILDLIRTDKGKRIMFITNRPEMKGLFRNTITVRNEDGISTVQQSG